MTEQPKRRVSPLELRLYVAALLAVVYTISWRALRSPAAAYVEPQRFVWIGSMPPSARPTIVLPANWQLATQSSTSRPTRSPNRRNLRVRTRSS
jgi:hypothetical protein